MQCVLLNDDVDPIVRRARSKLSMRWRYAEAQATVLLNDGFAVLDCERPDVESKLGGNGSDWFDVSGDRVGNVTRFRLSRASPPTAGTIRLEFAIDSTPGFDDSALGSFHGSWRVTQFLQWAAPTPLRRPSGASCASPSRARLAASRPLRAAVRARSSNSTCCRW
jgi:hypothetical protein